MTLRHRNLRNSVPNKRPSPGAPGSTQGTDVPSGRLVVNFAKDAPGLFIRDNVNRIVKIGPAEVGTAFPNSTPAGEPGNSIGEFFVDERESPALLWYFNGTTWKPATGFPKGDATLTSINGNQLGGMRNAIINGGFQVWQRGTSMTGAVGQAFTADRWFTRYDGAAGTKTISRERFDLGQTEVPGEPLYFMRFNQTATGAGTQYLILEQRIGNVQTYAGQTATLSMWVRTPDTTPLTLPRISYTQWFGTGGTPSSYTDRQIAASIPVSSQWTRLVYSVAPPSVAGKVLGTNDDDCLILQINLPVSGPFKLDIAQVQLEPGGVATPFERRQRTYELALCTAFGRWTQFNQALHAGEAGQALETPVDWATMRRVPKVSALVPDPVLTAVSTNVTSAAIERVTASGGSARVTATAAGLATHAGYRAWLDAELYLPGEAGYPN